MELKDKNEATKKWFSPFNIDLKINGLVLHETVQI